MGNDAPWTYTYNPASVPRDEVRVLIGDTNECDKLLYDGEIEYLLTRYNNSPVTAAIQACELIWAKFSRLTNETVGSVSIQFAEKAKGIQALQKMLMQRQAMTNCMPYAGGISRSDKQTEEQNTDRVKPDFTKKMLQNDGYARIAPFNQSLYSTGDILED